MNSALKEKILDEIESLDNGQLRQVLGSVRAAKGRKNPGATFGELLAEFGGSIPNDELDRMERAIEEDCERIDPD